MKIIVIFKDSVEAMTPDYKALSQQLFQRGVTLEPLYGDLNNDLFQKFYVATTDKKTDEPTPLLSLIKSSPLVESAYIQGAPQLPRE